MRFPSGVKQHRPRPAKTLLASAGLAVASTQQKTKICVQMRMARNPRPGRIPRLGQNKAIHLASLGNAPEKTSWLECSAHRIPNKLSDVVPSVNPADIADVPPGNTLPTKRARSPLIKGLREGAAPLCLHRHCRS